MKLVGILNITPDSFSDGGRFDNGVKARKQLEHMLKYKPYAIDIGAISTRPQAILISASEEIERFNKVLPFIEDLLTSNSVKVSVDSYHVETIEYLMKKIPIHWINDQSGFKDLRILDLVKNTDLKLVLMHHLDIPTKKENTVPDTENIVEYVKKWLRAKLEFLNDKGIGNEQIILDPGIGFGKKPIQSWQLIKNAHCFKDLGCLVMFGHSRKSFLNLITEDAFEDRDLQTMLVSLHLKNCGIDYVRVHNIPMHSKALDVINKFKEI